MKRKWEQRRLHGVSAATCSLCESTNNSVRLWTTLSARCPFDKETDSEGLHYFPKATGLRLAELARLSDSKAEGTNCFCRPPQGPGWCGGREELLSDNHPAPPNLSSEGASGLLFISDPKSLSFFPNLLFPPFHPLCDIISVQDHHLLSVPLALNTFPGARK